MRLLGLILISLIACLIDANPKIYNHQSPPNCISDFDMHPHRDPLKISPRSVDPKEKTSEYWMENAKKLVEDKIKLAPNTKKAKNVIMFLGDGMSTNSLAPARLLLGGEEQKLSFEKFPYTASSKTYCVDIQVADSACTATAYLTGVKTNDGEIGINAETTFANCEDNLKESTYVDSIAGWFQNQNRSAGLVTTTRVTHATPAGVYAHTTARDWEDDSNLEEDGCNSDEIDDIAEQLIYGKIGSKLKVILGGGSRHFIDKQFTENGRNGSRSDGKNLIEDWTAMKMGRKFIRTRQELMNTNVNEIEELFGMFTSTHIDYWLDVLRDNKTLDIPSLTDMTMKAIDVLNKDPNGYFLLVEGGRIDHGHHRTQAKYAMMETVEFSKAIEATVGKVNLDETLIVVTADHGHVMTMGGYADRGNDIYGFGGTGVDGMPYFTLSYANGESYPDHVGSDGKRVNPTVMEADRKNKNEFRFPATIPRLDETHGGEDVGVFAIGPWAHLFQGVIEQNLIPHIMAYASCVGSGLKSCDSQ